jgi:AraC family transcriptional activator of pobA
VDRDRSKAAAAQTRQDEIAVQRFLIYGLEERPTDDDFIHVESIEDRLDVHNWNVRPHIHPNLHQFMLFRSGAGEFLIEDTWHAFEAPVLIVAPPGTVHGFRLSRATSGPVVTIAEPFFREIAAGVEADIVGALDHPALVKLTPADLADHGLQEIFVALAREYRWAAVGKLTAVSSLVALLFVAFGRLTRSQMRGIPAEGKHDRLFARFRLAVEAHFSEARTIADYARELGVTPARLNTACRAVARVSALEVVHARLLAEAKRLLLYSMMTTSQVAHILGFKDSAYFSRWFSRRTGKPPGAFRANRERAAA